MSRYHARYHRWVVGTWCDGVSVLRLTTLATYMLAHWTTTATVASITSLLEPSLYSIPTYTMLLPKALVAASPANCRSLYCGACLSSDVY